MIFYKEKEAPTSNGLCKNLIQQSNGMGLASRVSTIMIIILLIWNSFTHFASKSLAKAWNSSNLEGF